MADKKIINNEKGIKHFYCALKWSLYGLRDSYKTESAFRQELFLFLIFFPLAFYIGENNFETALMILTLFLVLIVELINTSIEAAVNRISLEFHELSKKSKDAGSASVFLTILMTAFIWLYFLIF